MPGRSPGLKDIVPRVAQHPPPAVPFVALDRAHRHLSGDLLAAFERVVGASSFILGAEVEAFEAEFAGYVGVSHCVGVGSGTAALSIGLRALGIGPGDEVIVPAHTYVASAFGVVHAGATPVFCDVHPDTGLIDLASAAAVAGERTAAVLAVHLYGQLCDMDAVCAFAARRGLAVVEDAAQAHGATLRGVRAGQRGDLAAFSFYPSKNLGALGDGGAICTPDPAVAGRAARLRNLGQVVKGTHEVVGENARLDGLQAAVLRAKLPWLDNGNAARRRHAARYRAGLTDEVRVLPQRDGAEDVFHLFPVRCADRDRLAAALASAGVATGVHYSPAVHEQPPFRHLAHRTDLSVASAWAATELSLPMFPELRDDELDHVTSTLHLALSRGRAHEQRLL